MNLARVPSKQFRRDLRRLVKSGYSLEKLEIVIDTIAAGKALPENCRGHDLKGKFKGLRECHVGPDWLLLYEIDTGRLILHLLRTGTHRDTLGIE